MVTQQDYSFQKLFLSLVLTVVSLLLPKTSCAQELHQQWQVMLAPSKITGDPLDSQRFFNAQGFSIQYNKLLVHNIDWTLGIFFLQSIETEGGNGSDALDQALNRFHKSFSSLSTGVDLTPIRFSTFAVIFGLGFGIRHQMEVQPNFATISNQEVLVKDQYEKSWNLGGYTAIGVSQAAYLNWLIGIRGQIWTYNNGDSILSLGFSIGQRF